MVCMKVIPLGAHRKLTDPFEVLFPGRSSKMRDLRRANAEFDEVCWHLAVVIAELGGRFGRLDTETVELIACFEDLRREVERFLRAYDLAGNAARCAD